MVVPHMDQGAARAGGGYRTGRGSALWVAAHHLYQFTHAAALPLMLNLHLNQFTRQGAGNPEFLAMLAHHSDAISVQVFDSGFVRRSRGCLTCGAFAPFFMCGCHV